MQGALIDRARGALLGMAAGDALGTTLEFRAPGSFEPITDIVGGGPFHLNPGEWTDDTSMGLCLAESLIECGAFDPNDQMRRYVRWFRDGHLSSNGKCFDIGNQTRSALTEFERTGDSSSASADPEKAANGSIMRLAAVPVAYAPDLQAASHYAGLSSMTTHPAARPVDACRYMGALIAAAVSGAPTEKLLDATFWRWGELHPEIASIAAGSFTTKNPPQIQGSGYVVSSLEAALWALHNTDNFRDGALLAVNLGDDADTTGAVYGQIAGAIYGEEGIPADWRAKLARHDEIVKFADWLLDVPGRTPPTSESYWVAKHLLAGKYPGAKNEAEAKAKINALVEAGVRTFVDLTEEGELVPYAHLLPDGVAHHRIAVTDVTAPDASRVRSALSLVNAGREIGDVYLHCWGGCGRTGVIIGCYLRDHGWDEHQALARVTALTRAVQTKPCPETPSQIRTVTDWEPAGPSVADGTAARGTGRAQQATTDQSRHAGDRRDQGSADVSAQQNQFNSATDASVTVADIADELPELSEAEYPAFVTTEPQRTRWRVAVGVTRRIAQRDDFMFAREIYFSDTPTDPGSAGGPPPDDPPVLPISSSALRSADVPDPLPESLDGADAKSIWRFAASFSFDAFRVSHQSIRSSRCRSALATTCGTTTWRWGISTSSDPLSGLPTQQPMKFPM